VPTDGGAGPCAGEESVFACPGGNCGAWVLRVSYNDGLRCILNGTLIIDDLAQQRTTMYWTDLGDVTTPVTDGPNVLACRWRWAALAAWFDLDLTAGSAEVIPRSHESTDPTLPDADCGSHPHYRLYNAGGTPPNDALGLTVVDLDYDDRSWHRVPGPLGNTDSGQQPCTADAFPAGAQPPVDVFLRKRFCVDTR
jgi:hypothetical protein